MKILHVATGFPLTYPGGITNYVLALTEAQLAAGIDVHVLAGPGTDLALIPKNLQLHEFQSERIPPFTLRWVDRDFSSKIVENLLNRECFDLIHVHMTFGFSGDLLRYIASLDQKYIVSLHDYSHICPRIFMIDCWGGLCRTVDTKKCTNCVGILDQFQPFMRVQRRFEVLLPRIPSSMPAKRLHTIRDFLKKARCLLPVSKRVEEIYKDVVPEGRYSTLHIGNKTALNRDYLKTTSDKIRAVFIGTLDKKKGAAVLARLIQGCTRADIEFVFHGRADRRWGPALEAMGLKMQGPYLPGDLPHIMHNADIGLVLPIWEDNGPQVVMEFLNYRTPVLATRMGGIPDFVVPGVGFLFDPYVTEEVESAVRFLNELTSAHLSAMRAQIKPLLSPNQHSDALIDIYRKVLSS